MKNLTSEFAEILGLLCAEGSHIISYSSYWGKDKGKDRFFKNDKSERIEFSNNDKNLLNHYQELLSKEFNYKPKITKHNKVNICSMNIIRKIISYTKLGHLKWEVPQSVMESNSNIKISFLRGFFDGDGTISNNNVRFFSTNKNGLFQISRLLNDLEFRHSFQKPEIKVNKKPLFSLRIYSSERERFLNKIKPISKRPDIFMRG